MKIKILITALLLVSGYLVPFGMAAADNKRNFTVTVDGDGNAQFKLSEGNTDVYQVVQVSRDEDFSTIEAMTAKKLNKGSNGKPTATTVTIKGERCVKGLYYWRVYDPKDNDFYYGEETTVTFGSRLPEEYKPVQDETVYEPLELPDGSKLELESIWMLSNGSESNKLFKTLDFVSLRGNTISSDLLPTEFTPDNGLFVKDNIIYIPRGSSEYISGWKSDKSRLWLCRYDMLTGERLPLLKVLAPDGVSFVPAEYSEMKQVMNWIDTDADGTPYFCAVARNASKRKYFEGIYTIPLDRLTEETESVTPELAWKCEVDETVRYVENFTVAGSLKKQDFTLWGIRRGPFENIYVNEQNTREKIPVYMIKVNGSETILHSSEIDYLKSFDLSKSNGLTGRLSSHLTVVDGEHFYFHVSPSQSDVPWISPMLYKFVNNGICEVVGHLGNSEGVETDKFPAPSGVSVFEVGDTKFVAYGQGTADGKGTAVQVVTTPSFTDDFSGHKKIWTIGAGAGIPGSTFQSVNVKFLPDETPGTGGRMLAYVANGGLGLYRLNVMSQTVGVEALPEEAGLPLTAVFIGEVVELSRCVDGISIHSLSGQTVYRSEARSSVFAVPSLASGCYIMTTPSSPLAVKIIVPGR